MTTINSLPISSKETVKNLAAEFITLKMSIWLSKKENLDTLKKFNEVNSIDITKFLLYPFFTCIANGSFNLLYDLFCPFYAMEDGPVSSVSLNLVVKNSCRYFDLNDENYNIHVRDTEKTWEEIEFEIRNYPILLEDNTSITFENIVYDDDAGKSIVDSISSSILAISKQTDDGFISFDNYQIVTLARQHRSWSTIYNYFKDIPNSSLNDLIISKEDAQKDRKVFKSLEELYLQ